MYRGIKIPTFVIHFYPNAYKLHFRIFNFREREKLNVTNVFTFNLKDMAVIFAEWLPDTSMIHFDPCNSPHLTHLHTQPSHHKH